MNQFQKNIKSKALNEDMMLSNIYQRAEKDGLRSAWAKAPKESSMKKRSILFVGLAFVLTLAIVLFNPFASITKDQSNVVAAVISVDINPSFELSVNPVGLVIKIDALNDDAKSLNTLDLIGDPVEDVVDAIIALSAEAGFIDITDLEDDYVVVSTVLAQGTDAALGDTLQTRLHDRIQLSDTLQCINLVQLKATLQEQAQARDENVPVGLYVINGMIQNQTGEWLSVKEFFANSDNALALQSRAEITTISQEQIKARLELALDQMDEEGLDTVELRTRLENAGTEDMVKIQSEVKTQINKPDNPGNNDNGNGSSTDTDNDSGNSDENQNEAGSGTSSNGTPSGSTGGGSSGH
jgi:hypothetical protein